MLAISAAPCGYCRQFLNELTTASKLLIILPNTPTTLLTALLPDAFGPADLGVTAALMSPQSHGMTLSSPTDDYVTKAALQAANTSYAPYSLSYAGVALRTSDGAIYTGGVAENAAFNPSMSPLEAAVVTLTINGGKTYNDITDAVLVEPTNSQASQIGATRDVLGTITKVAREESEAYFHSRPQASQLGAWASPQSIVVSGRNALDAALANIQRQFADVDEVPVPPHWGGWRIRPEVVEFWQGRRDRMHDRLQFKQGRDGWKVERLGP